MKSSVQFWLFVVFSCVLIHRVNLSPLDSSDVRSPFQNTGYTIYSSHVSQSDHNRHSILKRSSNYHQVSNGYHGLPAPLKNDGTVDETPEVKHVKAARLSTLAQAFANAPKDYLYEEHQKPNAQNAQVNHKIWDQGWTKKYHGPHAPLKHDGTVDETHEVKHVKAAHLGIVAQAFANAPQDTTHGHRFWKRSVYQNDVTNPSPRYHGPPAPLKHDGTVDDTPEVKHIKAARLATLSEAFAKAAREISNEEPHYSKMNSHQNHVPWRHMPSQKYEGPFAPLKHDGTVDDTPEVKHVKAAHLAAFYEAFAKAPQDFIPEETNYGKGEMRQKDYWAPSVNKKYNGPPAPLKHDGTVDETPEVKKAKAEHLRALAKANHEENRNLWKRSAGSNYLPAVELRYHGPPAPLKHDGTVDETEEVKHIKAVRLSALSEAFAKAARQQDWQPSDGYTSGWKMTHKKPSHINLKYHGPPAPLKYDGTVDETPEVKQIKAAHLAIVADAFAKAPHDYRHEEEHKIWKTST